MSLNTSLVVDVKRELTYTLDTIKRSLAEIMEPNFFQIRKKLVTIQDAKKWDITADDLTRWSREIGEILTTIEGEIASQLTNEQLSAVACIQPSSAVWEPSSTPSPPSLKSTRSFRAAAFNSGGTVSRPSTKGKAVRRATARPPSSPAAAAANNNTPSPQPQDVSRADIYNVSRVTTALVVGGGGDGQLQQQLQVVGGSSSSVPCSLPSPPYHHTQQAEGVGGSSPTGAAPADQLGAANTTEVPQPSPPNPRPTTVQLPSRKKSHAGEGLNTTMSTRKKSTTTSTTVGVGNEGSGGGGTASSVAQQQQQRHIESLDVSLQQYLAASLHFALEAVCFRLKASLACCLKFDPKKAELQGVGLVGCGGVRPSSVRVPSKGGIAGSVFRSGVAVNVSNMHEGDDPHLPFAMLGNNKSKINTMLCFPLRAPSSQQIVGVVQVLNCVHKSSFSTEDESSLCCYALLLSYLLDRYSFDHYNAYFDASTLHSFTPFSIPPPEDKHLLPPIMSRFAPTQLIFRTAQSGQYIRRNEGKLKEGAVGVDYSTAYILKEVDSYMSNLEECWKKTVGMTVELEHHAKDSAIRMNLMKDDLRKARMKVHSLKQQLQQYQPVDPQPPTLTAHDMLHYTDPFTP